MNDPAEILYQIVTAQLGAVDDRESLIRQIRAVGQQALIEQQVVDRVIERVILERNALRSEAAWHPRLFVDWGELPSIGSSARPLFSLVCPEYTSRPEIRVVVDRDLDHDEADPLCKPRSDEPGLWTFHVPFRLTTLGLDCRPGQYLLDVHVTFPDAEPGQPRFFGTHVRLTVKSSCGDDSVLEISGDGQSIVNLQGCDLRSFSKVVLKAGQDGIINLQELSQTRNAFSASSSAAPKSVTFEYALKVDRERERRLPRLSTQFNERSYLERAGLYFENGHRVLLIAKRRVTLGRNRDNDIVLRFLPQSTPFDEFSRGISRTHISLELNDDGLLLIDDSSTGLELNSSLVEKSHQFSRSYVGESFRLELGCTVTVRKAFELGLELFGTESEADRDDRQLWDQIYLKTLGERMPRLWQTASECGISAVCLDRVDNLANEEGYVLLFQEVLLGGARSTCAITLPTRTMQPVARLLYAGRCFWIERLGERGVVELNDRELAPRELVPLVVGQQLNIDGVLAEFGHFRQLYIDGATAS